VKAAGLQRRFTVGIVDEPDRLWIDAQVFAEDHAEHAACGYEGGTMTFEVKARRALPLVFRKKFP
jgi:hypothetical protein